MGIKSLTKFLRDNYPEAFELIHISEYAFKKIAIDTSLYLCNFKALYGEEGWIAAFIKLVAVLRENNIHCVFIYDTGYPPEKEAERKERMEARAKQEEKVSRLEEAIIKYRDSGEIEDCLFDIQDKKVSTIKNLLTKKKTIDVDSIEFIVNKMRRQLFSISKEDFITTKQIFDILKVPYFNAPVEAETCASDLCLRGLVDAVLSEDTDVLAYTAPVFLTKFNTADGTCLRIKYNDLLEKMELESNQFLDFCIMCGTDYNKNIPKIGVKRALNLIKQFKSIENIAKNTMLDISILNHKRSRELFRDYEQLNVSVSFCGEPDFNKLQVFICKKNIRINIDNLRKAFVREIVFIDN